MFALKPISHESVAATLAKAERYRLLNEPSEAESICCDVLEIEPANRQAQITLLLALTDQIGQEPRAFPEAIAIAERLESPYDRAYYAGIAWERRAKARHNAAGHNASHYAYGWLVNALMLFEKAEALRAPGNDEVVLRWNACVRYLESHKEIAPVAEETPEPILSE
jgi:hypothetical protein